MPSATSAGAPTVLTTPTVNGPYALLNGSVMNTTLYSAPLQVANAVFYDIQVVFTGTPTGTFKLQCSNDPAPPQSFNNTVTNVRPVNWTDISTSPQTVSSAGSGNWNVYNIGYNWVRLVYTDASGGTSTAVLTSAVSNVKGV